MTEASLSSGCRVIPEGILWPGLAAFSAGGQVVLRASSRVPLESQLSPVMGLVKQAVI